MKTIFTLLSSLLLSVAVFAADAKPKSMLAIKSADYGDIKVIIDGRRFEPGDNEMRIRSIESGYHQVKIYREKNTGIFNIFGKRYEVVYNSTLSLRPRTSVLISVDRFGRASVSEDRMMDRGWNDRNDRNDFDFDHSGKFGDYDSRDAKYDGRDGRDGRYDGRDDRGYGSRATMTDNEFNLVLQAIGKEWFENNKKQSASHIIDNNFMTVSQVRQLLLQFSFETNKLELAKQAYAKTVDQKNYFMLNDVFSFSSSKDELARYIRNFH